MTCPYKPTEFNVVIELDPIEETTSGGIILISSTKEADELAGEEGTLIAVSPHAFTYAENWPVGEPPPQVGQRVMFARHQGVLRKRKVDGVERAFRIVKDKDIVAVIEEQANG